MSQTITPNANKEAVAQMLWTGFILMFFLIQAVIWTVAISITASDRSHAVVAGYDEKALHWDEERAAIAASQRLGWNVTIEINSADPSRSSRVITLTILDVEKTPVVDAAIELTAFHRARAADARSITLAETEPGVYTSEIAIRKSGRWQFEGTAVRDQDTFIFQHETKL